MSRDAVLCEIKLGKRCFVKFDFGATLGFVLFFPRLSSVAFVDSGFACKVARDAKRLNAAKGKKARYPAAVCRDYAK